MTTERWWDKFSVKKLCLVVWMSSRKMGETGLYPKSKDFRMVLGDVFYYHDFIPFNEGKLSAEDLDLLVSKIGEAFDGFGVIMDIVVLHTTVEGAYSGGCHWSNLFPRSFDEEGVFRYNATHIMDHFDPKDVRSRILNALPMLQEDGDDICFGDSRYPFRRMKQMAILKQVRS